MNKFPLFFAFFLALLMFNSSSSDADIGDLSKKNCSDFLRLAPSWNTDGGKEYMTWVRGYWEGLHVGSGVATVNVNLEKLKSKSWNFSTDRFPTKEIPKDVSVNLLFSHLHEQCSKHPHQYIKFAALIVFNLLAKDEKKQ